SYPPQTPLFPYTTLFRSIQDPGSKIQIVEVGTGSGCIAIALAHRCSQAKVYAIDVSPEALEVARINAARRGVNGQVEFLPGDLRSEEHTSELQSLAYLVC